MSEKSLNQLTLSASRTMPDQLRPDVLQRAVQADNLLSPFQKRQLIKQMFRTTFLTRQQQFQASLEVQKHSLAAQVSVIETKIDVEKDTIALGIREAFLKTLADLGMRVEMSQLEFMTEFGVRLKSFRHRLDAQDIDADERDRILEMSRNSFNRVYQRLVRLTDGIESEARSGGEN